MDYSDDRLQKYINRMLILQDEQREKPLSDQELKEIALELGMSEEDWLDSQETAKAHLKSGQGHLRFGNWKEAIQELEQANALIPNSVEATYSLAKAYAAGWLEAEKPAHQEQAQKYAQRTLKLQPGHSEALQIIRDIRTAEEAKIDNKTTLKYVLAAVAGLILLIIIILYTFLSNAAATNKEEVASKWAQVENVYQRRSDLVPQLVRTAQSAANFEKKNLQKIIQVKKELGQLQIDRNKLDKNQLANFQQKQSELLSALNSIMASAQNDPTLSSSQAFRDLQVQLEGSQNRISVEKKRFNEAVAKYNTFASTFPGSLLGLGQKEYLKMEQGADKIPEINFE